MDQFHSSDRAAAGARLVRYAVIDAFTDTPYRGNPAAVLLLEEINDTEWMQKVANEFHLSQTCFLRKRPPVAPPEHSRENGAARENYEELRKRPPVAPPEHSRENGAARENYEEFDLRWFTPFIEVDLCGHGTVAAAHFLFSSGFVNCNVVLFHTRSGILTAGKIEGFKQGESAKPSGRKTIEEFAVELKFPQTAVFDCDSSEISSLSSTLKGLAVNCVKQTASGDFIIELASGEFVRDLQPQFDELLKCNGRGIIVTGLAPERSGFDFFSRVFFPKLGINEDPVCGSAHCALAPYWATKLGKKNLIGYQASQRGGKLVLKVVDQNHVLLQGEAVKVMSGILTAE